MQSREAALGTEHYGYSIVHEGAGFVIRRAGKGLGAFLGKLLGNGGERVRIVAGESEGTEAIRVDEVADLAVYKGRHLEARRRKNRYAPSWCAKLQTRERGDIGPEFRFRSREQAEAFANAVRRELAALRTPEG